jgi:hypothetical protein
MAIVHFLPWCHLECAVQVLGVEFLPWQRDEPFVQAPESEHALRRLLSCYRNVDGEPVANATILRLSGVPLDAELTDEQIDLLREATELVCFAALASREFFGALQYTNSSAFTLIGQRFENLEFIAVVTRRRDGRNTSAWPLEEVTFSRPHHVSQDAVKRGLAGQHARGFATGAKTFGYRTVAVPDPSGKREPNGAPALLGKRVEIDPAEAAVVQRIFEWAADGVGVATIVERLNRKGGRGPRGRRWGFSVVRRMLENERYRGRQIWGQQRRERQPGTNHKVARLVPREQWHIHERPDLQIISDVLWERVQVVRSEVRQSVAPKRNLARGRDARFHSPHLFSGFMKCGCCGGAITTVSGGKGSPRFGCSRSWRNGVSACPNRLTIRVKVAEPQLLGKLQRELLEEETLSYVTKAVQAELARASEGGPERASQVRERLTDKRRKRQNLVTAIEGGA